MALEKKVSKKKKLIAASVAGLMALVGSVIIPGVSFAATEQCYGINACKGTGDCGGKGHSCAGMNACKGQAYLEVPEGLCGKIQGGSLTPSAEVEVKVV